jgi:phage head maturation protease
VKRSFDLDGLRLRDEGNVAYGRIVPFNEVATVVEPDETGHLISYREGFLPGSLTMMEQVAKKRGNLSFVGLNLDHEEGALRKVAYATSLEQRDDGAYAEFRMYRSADLEKVLDMLRSSHTGLSIEFTDRARPIVRDDVTWRRQVNLFGVAATPSPAYSGAGLVSVRDNEPEVGTPMLDEVQVWLAGQEQVDG